METAMRKIRRIPATDGEYARGTYLRDGRAIFAGDRVQIGGDEGVVRDVVGCLRIQWDSGGYTTLDTPFSHDKLKIIKS